LGQNDRNAIPGKVTEGLGRPGSVPFWEKRRRGSAEQFRFSEQEAAANWQSCDLSVFGTILRIINVRAKTHLDFDASWAAALIWG
jgi:hypothetical protein